MMRRPVILLVNPWIHDFAAYDLWARPMGLLLLGTRLRRLGWEPLLVDCVDQDHPGMAPVKERQFSHSRFFRTPIDKPPVLSDIPRVFSRYGVIPDLVEADLAALPPPEAVLVTSLMTYWYSGVRETVDLVRRVFPDVPVLIGGIYASLLPEHAAVHCRPDEILRGPGEETLPNALYRHTGISNQPSAFKERFEFSPALDLMTNVRFLPLLTTRGCCLKCSYCASSLVFPHFVRRHVSEVIKEIQTGVNVHRIHDIALYDDAFLLEAHAHALPILDAAAHLFQGLRWHTPNGLHASAIDSQVAVAMKQAGFETIRIGFETSSDEFHRRTGGKTGRMEFLNAVKNLLDAGIPGGSIGAYLLVGLPGQTTSEVEDDVELVLRSGVVPKLAEYSPIPGTAMWSAAIRASRYPLETEPLFHNCTLLPAASDSLDPKFIQKTRRRISEQLVLTLHKHVDT